MEEGKRCEGNGGVGLEEGEGVESEEGREIEGLIVKNCTDDLSHFFY